MIQTELDFTARDLRDAGIKKAVDHADRVNDGWSEEAYKHLRNFLKFSARPDEVFMVENIRGYAEFYGFPEPPSNRAWGHIIVRAAREGLVKKVGYQNTTNPRAHCAPATLWQKI